MSDFSEYDEEAPEIESPGIRKYVKQLEAQIKEANDRNARAERELAFAKVPGLDLSDPKVSYFTKGYEGEFTPEAIRQAAESAGFLNTEAPAAPPQELVEHQRAASLSAGVETQIPEGNAEYEAAMALADTPEKVFAAMDKYGSPRSGMIIPR